MRGTIPLAMVVQQAEERLDASRYERLQKALEETLSDHGLELKSPNAPHSLASAVELTLKTQSAKKREQVARALSKVASSFLEDISAPESDGTSVPLGQGLE